MVTVDLMVVREEPGRRERAFSAYGKLKMYTERMASIRSHVPGPQYLIRDQHLQNNCGLNERNFSFGERLDLSAPANDYPGCKYVIPGFCDRFERTKRKNVPGE